MKNIFKMKRILFFSSVVLILAQACGQKKVPENVIAAFNSRFEKATHVRWDRENQKEWEAEFKMDGKSYAANYSNQGEWMETEYHVELSELPDSVKSALDTFKNYKVKASEVSETNAGKNFEFILKNNEEKLELVIDGSGKILEQKEAGEESDQD